jgi:HEAT repeat protein
VAVALSAALLGAWMYSRDAKPPYIWIQWLRREGVAERSMAAEELGRMGADARSAVPTLADTLLFDHDASIRKQAANALMQILSTSEEDRAHPAANAALLGALRDRDSSVRSAAAAALGVLQPDPKLANPALLTAMDDEEPDVRSEAVNSLVQLVPADGMGHADAQRAVFKALTDKHSYVQDRGIYAFWVLTSKAPKVVDAVLTDPDVQVRLHALEAFCRNSGSAGAAVPSLIAAMKDLDARVRAKAATALSVVDPARVGFAPPGLIAGLKDPDSRVRKASALTLGHLGSHSRNAITALTQSLTDEDGEVRIAAERALVLIKIAVVEEDQTVAMLIDRLKRGNPVERANTVDWLQKIGPAASSAIPALTKLIADDPDEDLRESAARARDVITATQAGASP